MKRQGLLDGRANKSYYDDNQHAGIVVQGFGLNPGKSEQGPPGTRFCMLEFLDQQPRPAGLHSKLN